MMGAIVSSRKQALNFGGETFPSEDYAREAKLRQAALPTHLPLVHKLQRKEAFDLNSSGDEEDIREWYPAGVSPWHFEDGVLEMTEGAPDWMDDMSITAMELHRAAIIIQRVLRGYQTRKTLIKENQGAMKIQRSYRQYKKRQSQQNLTAPGTDSYLTTTKISFSTARGNVPTGNAPLWQHTKSSSGEHPANSCRSDATKQRLKFQEECARRELVKAVEIPITQEAKGSREGRGRTPSREKVKRSRSPTTPLQALQMRKEEMTLPGQDITFPVLRPTAAAKDTTTNFSTAAPTRQEVLCPDNHRPWSPLSPDSGIERNTESRESVNTVFGGGLTGNCLLGSIPSLRESLPNVKEASKSTSYSKSNDTHQYNRNGVSNNSIEAMKEATIGGSCSNNSSLQQTINYQDFWSTSAHDDDGEGSRFNQPPPVLHKPDSSDALHIAIALAESKDFLRGQHDTEYFLNYDPPMHPVMLASHSLRGAIQKSSREGRHKPSIQVSRPVKSGDTSFEGYIGGSVQGTNYQRLMEEMRSRRKTEMEQQKVAQKENSNITNKRSSRQRTNRTSSTQKQKASTSGKITKENDLPTSMRKLSVIDEDESSDLDNTDCLQHESTDPRWSEACQEPAQTSNTLCIPSEQDKPMDMDPLIKLLYQEIAECNGDGSRKSSPADPGRRDKEKEEGDEETEEDLALGRQLIERMRTAMVKRQLTKNDMRSSKKDEESMYGHNSILIAPPDVQMLLKAAEFRGGVVRKLKHLTTAIRLDYHDFMNTVEQTLFYAAQQAEASLHDYEPKTLLLISSTVPKCTILRHAAKPGVLVHIYDFAGSLNDLLDDVAKLLQNVRHGAKVKNLGIVCKGGPGYFYLIKQVPVTPAKLRNNDALLQFWQGLGQYMSKLFPGQSVIHLMESNVAGNRQGENLLSDLEAALYSHQVKVLSPLEMAPSGREMLNIYFDSGKHKLWKMMRYTKLRIYK